MTRILLAIAFAMSFMLMMLGIITAIYIDGFTGFLIGLVGGIYFFRYLPQLNHNYMLIKNNKQWRKK